MMRVREILPHEEREIFCPKRITKSGKGREIFCQEHAKSFVSAAYNTHVPDRSASTASLYQASVENATACLEGSLSQARRSLVIKWLYKCI